MDKIYNENIKTIQEIAGGVKNGYHWFITSIKGSHPCAYVIVEKNHPYYEKDFEYELKDVVHGGITYNESSLNNIVKKKDEKWVFGWDYAHAGDFSRISMSFGMDFGNSNGKKWTIEEIKEDVNSFIEFLDKAEY